MSDSEDEKESKRTSRARFSGEIEDWDEFRIAFRNQARSKGYLPALKKGGESDLPADSEVEIAGDSEAEKKQVAARKRLFRATADLVLALKGIKDLKAIIKNSCTTEWPDGQAHVIWEKLLHKYERRDAFTPMEKANALKKCVIGASDKPDDLFNLIAEVEAKYGSLTEDEKIAQIMIGMPEAYQSDILSVQRTHGASATLEQYQDAFNEQYRLKVVAQEAREGADEEVGLVAGAAYFPGKCHECGKTGHKKDDCPNKNDGGGGGGYNGGRDGGNRRRRRNQRNQGKFRGKCNNCHKRGHKRKECTEPGGGAHQSGGDDEAGAVEVMLGQLDWHEGPYLGDDDDDADDVEYDMDLGDDVDIGHYSSAYDRVSTLTGRRYHWYDDSEDSDAEDEQNGSGEINTRTDDEEDDSVEDGDEQTGSAGSSCGDEDDASASGIVEDTEDEQQMAPDENDDEQTTAPNNENDDEDVSIDVDARADEARVQQMLAMAAKAPVYQFNVADAYVQMPMVEDEYDDEESSTDDDSAESTIAMDENPSHDEDDDGQDDELIADIEAGSRVSIDVTTGAVEVLQEVGAAAKEYKASMPATLQVLSHPNVWVLDTGASMHSKKNEKGLINMKKAQISTQMGSGPKITATKVGQLEAAVCDKDGNVVHRKVIVKEVAVNEGSHFNLFAICRYLKEGWSLGGDKTGVWIEKNGIEIKADIVVKTARGMLCAIYLAPLKNNGEAAAVMTAEGHQLSYVAAHRMLGHMSEEKTRKTAKLMGWKITPSSGTGPCVSCATAKAKQKNVPKESDSEPRADRVFLDGSRIKKPKDAPEKATLNAKNCWTMVVHDKGGLKRSVFTETKNGMINPIAAFFKRKENTDHPVKVVRCDNAGENRKLEEVIQGPNYGLTLTFEYTPPDGPQFNGKVERGFATIAAKGRAMMFEANLSEEQRLNLFPEAFRMAEQLDGLEAVEVDGITATRYEHAGEKNPKWQQCMVVFGRAGVVRKFSNAKKIHPRGIICMMVGYPDNHAEDVYLMYNPATGKRLMSRDVIWLPRMMYSKKNRGNEVVSSNDVVEGGNDQNDADDDEPPPLGITNAEAGEGNSAAGEGNSENVEAPANEAQAEETPSNENSAASSHDDGGRVTRSQTGSLRRTDRLIESMGVANATDLQQQYISSLVEALEFDDDEIGAVELALVGAGIGSGIAHTSEIKPMKLNEARKAKHIEPEALEASILDEFERMVTKNKIWDVVLRRDMEPSATIVSSTWAVKKKASGRIRSRVTIRGFEQRPGKDYDPLSLSAPVVNQTTLFVCLTIVCMMRGLATIVDVEGAFLLGSFDKGERFYMEIPDGMHRYVCQMLGIPEDSDLSEWIIRINGPGYGAKQAAHQYYLELADVCTEIEVEKSEADPCCWFKWTDNGLVLMVSWVDDIIIMGPDEAVGPVKERFMNEFPCTDEGEMKEYVGNKIDYDRELGAMKFTQPVLIQSLEDEFEDSGRSKPPETPAIAGSVLIKAGTKLGPKRQSELASLAGKTLYLGWSRPEAANPVREISRHMSEGTEEAYEQADRLKDYFIATKDRGRIIRPQRRWDGIDRSVEFEIRGMSDSNYATDPETRKSVTGLIVFFEGVVVASKSGGQNTAALSTTEAEWNAAVSCAQSMLHVMNIVESLGLKVKKPMILQVDNKGAVDLANGFSVGGRSKHFDVKVHFMRELKQVGLLRVEFISGDSNQADILTKNVAGPLLAKHSVSMVTDEKIGIG